MKKQRTTAADLGAAAAASNAHLKGFQQYHTPVEWATALAAGLPYRRYSVADLFAGTGNLLKGIANETTRDLYSLELDPDAKPLRQAGMSNHFVRGDFNDWLPLATEVSLKLDLVVANPPFSLTWPMSEALRKADDKGLTIDSTLAAIRATNLLLADHIGEGLLIGNFASLQRLRTQFPHDFRHVWLSLRMPSFFPGVKIEVGVLYFAKWFDRTKLTPENRVHPEWIHIQGAAGRDPGMVADCITHYCHPDYRWQEIQEFFQRTVDAPKLWDAVGEETRRRRETIASGNHNLEVDPDSGLLRTWITMFQEASAQVPAGLAKALVQLNRCHPLELVLQKDTREAMRKAIECGLWTVSPDADAAIREAIDSYHHGRSPVQPISPVQAIAWLDDQDAITCKKNFGPFLAGHIYALTSETVRYKKPESRWRIRAGQREREVVEVRGYDLCLSIKPEAGEATKFYYNPKRTDPAAHSLQDLVDHFEVPHVADLAELQPEAYQAHLNRLTDFEALTR